MYDTVQTQNPVVHIVRGPVKVIDWAPVDEPGGDLCCRKETEIVRASRRVHRIAAHGDALAAGCGRLLPPMPRPQAVRCLRVCTTPDRRPWILDEKVTRWCGPTRIRAPSHPSRLEKIPLWTHLSYQKLLLRLSARLSRPTSCFGDPLASRLRGGEPGAGGSRTSVE